MGSPPRCAAKSKVSGQRQIVLKVVADIPRDIRIDLVVGAGHLHGPRLVELLPEIDEAAWDRVVPHLTAVARRGAVEIRKAGAQFGLDKTAVETEPPTEAAAIAGPQLL